MKLFTFIVILFTLASFKGDKHISVDKEEAQQAFEYLNKVRTNPEQYYQELHFPKNTKVSQVKLVWNDTLAKVAENKAMDMAKHNYFNHVTLDGYGINYLINKAGYTLNKDWIKKKNANNFESIAANNPTGIEAIKTLIIDKGVTNLGHRKHLLGLDQWNSTLSDVGIGFARCPSGSAYQTYICVIIAKHDW